MLFFYIRHGDPIYNPDSLTPLGERQAEAVGKRLALYGIDKIYSSTSNRAFLTAKPTAEILKKDIEQLDFAKEGYAWQEMTAIDTDEKRRWFFQNSVTRKQFVSDEIRELGDKWYTHPAFKDTKAKSGIDRVTAASDELFKSLGYEHINGTGTYKVLNDNNDRVALFAHQGFGLLFFSCFLDIPYPQFAMHFDMSHSGMTVVEFKNENRIAIPKILTFANDSHLYREGLPTKYNNEIYF
ncbi:MAG: histidine phosphatase family protein [Clostridia bacterium]|nr:histidine phosphatase family protein [Clostridia bacterium]